MEADPRAGYARTYLITPGLIYGLASGPVFDAGIANRTSGSRQIPSLIRAALDRQRSGTIGPGKAVWPIIHVDDVAALFLMLFDTVRADTERAGHGWAGYYFLENGHSSWADIGRAIGRAIGRVLVELGVAPAGASEPTPFMPDELTKFWGCEVLGNYWGTTCRCRADRARTLGWTPTYSVADMLSEGLMRAEVELQLQAARANGGVVDFSFEKSLAKLVETVMPLEQ
ncbi:hypothetical protein C8Q72DRAFT_827307 [Fomitopsis betulina]|nr:hypothetical protein C8Q72DRAFT_827307 [Fomitopsis betulina]